MKIGASMQHAISGIQKGLEGLQRNAAEIASSKQMRGEADPVKQLVGLKQDKLQVEANAKVIKAVDEMLGSLFDDKA